MTDANQDTAAATAAPLSAAQPYRAVHSNSGPAEACGEARGPVSLDLEDAAGRLRAIGVRCRLGEDGLWAGKLCATPSTTKLYDRRGYNPERAASFFATY